MINKYEFMESLIFAYNSTKDNKNCASDAPYAVITKRIPKNYYNKIRFQFWLI